MAINKQDLIYLILVIALAGVSAILIGNPNPQIGLISAAGILAIVMVMAIYVKPNLGADVLIIAVFTNISRQFTDNGLPSVIKPLVALVAVTLIARYINAAIVPPDRAKTRSIESYLFFFLMVTAFSYLPAENKDRALEAILDLAKDIAIVYIILFTLRSPETWKQSAWVIMGITAIMCLLGAYQVITGNYAQNFFGLANVVDDVGSYSTTHRISGPINEPNIWGQVVAAVTPLALYRVIHERRMLTKIISVGILGILLFEVLNSYSRGAYIGLGIVFFLALLQMRLSPMAWFAGVAAVVFVIPFLPSSYMARFETLTLLAPSSQGGIYSEGSFRGRASKILTGLSMFADKPLLGVGAGNYPNNYQRYTERVGLELASGERDPHSLYVQLLAEEGILGAIAFVGFSITLLVGLSRARASISHLEEYRDWVPWISAIQLAILSYLITSTFLHGAYLRFFWILAGLAISAIHLTTEALNNSEKSLRERLA
jgi:hypothetical protein